MAIGITQAVCSETGFASPVSLSFTADFRTHENATPNGANPAEGSTLVVAPFSTADVTAVETDQGDIGVEVYDPVGGTTYWVIEDISAGVTGLVITQDASASIQTFVIESDVALTLQDTSAWALTGNGFSATQDVEYTTLVDGELAVAFTYANTANREFLDGTLGTVLAFSTTENRALIYAIVPTAGTGDLDWSMSTGQTFSASLVTFQEVGGAASVPPSVFRNANQLIGY